MDLLGAQTATPLRSDDRAAYPFLSSASTAFADVPTLSTVCLVAPLHPEVLVVSGVDHLVHAWAGYNEPSSGAITPTRPCNPGDNGYSALMLNSRIASTRLWRIAALVLLLCAGFDLVAIDTALWRPSNSASTDCGCPSDEDCFCCCRHVEVVPAVVFRPMQFVAIVEQQPPPQLHSIQPPAPFHPPRA